MGVGRLAEEGSDANQSAADMGLHGTQGQSRAGRDLGVRQTLLNGQFEHVALFIAKLGQRIASPVDLLAQLESIQARLGSDLAVVQGLRLGASGLSTLPIDQASTRYEGYKRCFGGKLRVVPVGVLPKIDEDVLDRVLSVGHIGTSATGQRPDQSAIPRQTTLNGFGVALGYRREQEFGHSRRSLTWDTAGVRRVPGRVNPHAMRSQVEHDVEPLATGSDVRSLSSSRRRWTTSAISRFRPRPLGPKNHGA